MKRTHFLFIFSVVFFSVANYLILQKEKTLKHGIQVFLRLAPVDPRSIMQGDYMILRYAVARNVPPKAAKKGFMVITLDPKNVAVFRKIYSGEKLAKGEYLLKYKKVKWRVHLGAESFFFQEGHAKYYEKARYGELRLEKSGKAVLVGLRNADFSIAGPPKKE